MRVISLKTGLTVILGVLATSAIAFLGLKAESTLTREGLIHQRQVLTALASHMRHQLDRGMFERFRDIGNAATLDTLRNGTPEAQSALIDRLRDTYPAYAWIGLTDADGIVRVSTDDLLEGADVSARPWFRGAAARTTPFADDVHEAQLLASLLPQDPTNGPIRFVDFAATVRDTDNRFLGVLGAHLRWTWAADVRRSILREWAGVSGVQIYILRADGTILLGYDEEIGTRLPCRMSTEDAAMPARFGEMVCADQTRYIAAELRTTGYQAYPGLGWIVLARQNVDVALAPVRQARQDLITWGVLLTLSFAAIGWLVAGWVTRPMRNLALAADKVRRGDPSADLPAGGRFSEFAMLTRSLRSMLSALTMAQRRIEMTAAETALEKRRLDTIVASMKDALAVVRDGRVVFANATFQRLAGHSGGRTLPTMETLIHPEDQPRMAAAIAAVAAGGPDVPEDPVELRVITPDGRTHHAEVSLSAFEGSEDRGVLVILHDITERVLSQRQLAHSQRIEALGNLAGGIAHDFNNLLTVIVGNLDLVDDALRDAPEARAQAERALGAALRGAQLTRQLLTFSRKRPLAPERLALNDLVTESATLLQRTLGGDVVIFTDLDADLWSIEADRAQMDSAIANLAINARDAMPDGGTLVLRTANRPGDDGTSDRVMLEVTDTGSGIDPDVLPHVLEPFFTTKDEGKGTGLGLPMIHGFVLQSGGTMDIDSTPGHGTRITLLFPRATGVADALTADTPLPELPANLSVLLVEDRDEVRRVLGEQLRRLGCTVTEAMNGPVALDRLDPGFDLLVTDIRLPGGINGMAIAAAARRRQPGLPVVFVTGHSGLAPDEEARLRRMGTIVDKPFRLRDLMQAMRVALDRPYDDA